MGPDPHALDLGGLPTGAPPAIGYEQGDAASQFRQYAVLADATVQLEDSTVRVTGPGGLDESYPSESGISVNDSHDVVAWVTIDGVVMVWQAGGSEAIELATTDLIGPQVEAVTGSDCVSDEGTCRVWLRGSDSASYEPASIIVAPGGVVPFDGLVQVRDASDTGTAVGTTKILSDGSCSAVVDTTSQARRFETCDYQLDALSPSGEYALSWKYSV